MNEPDFSSFTQGTLLTLAHLAVNDYDFFSPLLVRKVCGVVSNGKNEVEQKKKFS